MKNIKLFFPVLLTVSFCASTALAGVVIQMEMASAKGDNYQKTDARYYVVPLASRLDMDITMPPIIKKL